jgi:hypothetical protein
VINLPRSKADQEQAGEKVAIVFGEHKDTCPIRALRQWLTAAKLKDGAVFRGVDRHGNVAPDGLHQDSIATIFKTAARRAGMNATNIAGHSVRAGMATVEEIEPVTTPGVLAPSTYELLYEIERQPMTMSYKMLLLMFMAELADTSGKVPLRSLAEAFQQFFVKRALEGKAEENPNRRLKPGALAGRTVAEWERVIRTQPVHYLGESFVLDDGTTIRWAPRIWHLWDSDLKREIHAAAFDRLIRYFQRNVPGGF